MFLKCGQKTTTHWVTSPKWQNENFLPPSLQRTLILTVTHEQVCLCRSPGIQCTMLEKTYIYIFFMLDTLKIVTGNSFTLPVSPLPKAAQLSAKRDQLSPWFLPWQKVRVCEQGPIFPSYARPCQRDPLLFHPCRILRSAAQLWVGSTGTGSSC